MAFNHISIDIDPESVEELSRIYEYYHKQATCLKWQYKRFKRLLLALNMSSLGLTISGTVSGVVTLNPIVIGLVTGAGVLIQGYITKITSSRSRRTIRC